MRKRYKNDKIKFYIGDTKDYDSIANAVNGSDYVFQAAALKQVPSCEFFPIEAVKTNILGTENVLDSAIKNKVKKVIVLSTDKAANPINLYGATKLASDKLFVAANNYGGRNKQCRVTYRCKTHKKHVICNTKPINAKIIEMPG